IGSTSLQCDTLTGQCPCKAEFGGQDCSRCALGYRDYPDCVACDCDLSGTKVEMCDEGKGLCAVSHPSPRRCSPGYYGDPRGAGGSCEPCRCHPGGSTHGDCDRTTGQCACKAGVTGRLCEECQPRHLLVE
ncbi:EPI1 protein, partial [Crypturellus soui]|nr:EPI1 protein [Crypturellus soui]